MPNKYKSYTDYFKEKKCQYFITAKMNSFKFECKGTVEHIMDLSINVYESQYFTVLH